MKCCFSKKNYQKACELRFVLACQKVRE
ncbi:tetratricopeptide repeat protein [Campylobacter magnus]